MVLDTLLVRGYRLARGEHGPLELGFEDFAERVFALTRTRLQRTSSGARQDPDELERALEGLHFSDLYLAIACDKIREGAFDLFLANYRGRIQAFLARSGLEPAQASGLIHDLQGDLASPPPDRRARTRLGTYEGTSSLFSWLAVLLRRRRADLCRRASLERRCDASEHGSAPLEAHASKAAGPLDELLGREAAERAALALRAALAAMTLRERRCLQFRFVEGLAQREIARRLAIGEPRVSRLLERAVGKSRAGILRACGGEPLVPGGQDWQQMRDTVGIGLRSLQELSPTPYPRRPRLR